MRWLLLLLITACAVGQQPDKERAHKLNEEAVVLFGDKDYAKALPLFEEARRLDPDNEVIGQNLARALHGRAFELKKAGSLRQAEEALRAAIDLDGEEPAFDALLAEVQVLAGSLFQARRTLETALKEHPDSAQLVEGLGRLEYREEFLEEAAQCLETAAKLDPKLKESPRFVRFLKKVRREKKVESRFFKETRGQFSVKYDDEGFRRVGASVLDLLDRSYDSFASDLRVWPKDQLTVILYTRSEYKAATGAHSWTGGLFDGKIRVPVRNWDRLQSEIRATLDHELAHWFIRKLCPRVPTWLNEGMAQLREGKRPGRVTGERISAARRAGRYRSVASLPASWAGIENRDEVSLYYSQALHFTRYLVDRHGWSALASLLEGWRSGEEFAAAFKRVLRVDLASAEQDWLRGLR